jgi:hypothetical protein
VAGGAPPAGGALCAASALGAGGKVVGRAAGRGAGLLLFEDNLLALSAAAAYSRPPPAGLVAPAQPARARTLSRFHCLLAGAAGRAGALGARVPEAFLSHVDSLWADGGALRPSPLATAALRGARPPL